MYCIGYNYQTCFFSRHTREYKTALRCAMDLAKGCLATVGQSADILPDVDRLSDGISYICRRLPGEAMGSFAT